MKPTLFSLKSLSLAALLFSAGAAHADITVYTDKAAFLAAVSAPGVDTYNDLSIQLYDPTMNRTAGAYSYSVTSDNGLYGSGVAGDHWLSNNRLTDPITFSGFSSGVSAFGGNFFGTGAAGDFVPNTTMTLLAEDGTSISYTLNNTTLDSFVGFVSSSTLASVTLTSGGADYWPTANDVTLAMAVPEPGEYGMMLAGFGLLGFVARRRR